MDTQTEAKISRIEEIQNGLYDLEYCLKYLQSEIDSRHEHFQYCFCVSALKSVEEVKNDLKIKFKKMRRGGKNVILLG